MSDGGFTRNRLAWLDAIIRDFERDALRVPGRLRRSPASSIAKEVTRGPAKPPSPGFWSCTRRGVQKAIDNLVERGYLEVHIGGGRGHANEYRMSSEKVNHGSPFINGKGEPPFALSQREKVNRRSTKGRTAVPRKGEPRFAPSL